MVENSNIFSVSSCRDVDLRLPKNFLGKCDRNWSLFGQKRPEKNFFEGRPFSLFNETRWGGGGGGLSSQNFFLAMDLLIYLQKKILIFRMMIWLPTELWVDILKLLSRRDLLRRVQPTCR